MNDPLNQLVADFIAQSSGLPIDRDGHLADPTPDIQAEILRAIQDRAVIKAAPVRVFENAQANQLSSVVIDCRRSNALYIAITLTGTTPSATISVEGSEEAGGIYQQLPNSSSVSVSANTTFVVSVGTAFAKIRIASIAGTYLAGQGFTVTGTAYISGYPGKSITDSATTTPTIYNVTLTNANTEYSQALPTNCRGFDMQPQSSVDVRFAFVTGKVAASTAPYATMKAGVAFNSRDIAQGASPSTIYLASGTAGTIVEIIAWT